MWRQLEVLRDRKGHRQRRWSVDYEPCLSYKLRGGSKWKWGSAVWKWSWPESFIVSIEQKRSDDGGALQRHVKLNGKLSSLLFRFCFLSRKKKTQAFPPLSIKTDACPPQRAAEAFYFSTFVFPLILSQRAWRPWLRAIDPQQREKSSQWNFQTFTMRIIQINLFLHLQGHRERNDSCLLIRFVASFLRTFRVWHFGCRTSQSNVKFVVESLWSHSQ